MSKRKAPISVGDLPKSQSKTSKKPARKHDVTDAQDAYGFVSKGSPSDLPKAKVSSWGKWIIAAQRKAESLIEKAREWPEQNLPKPLREKLHSASSTAKAALVQIEHKHLAHLPFYQQKIRPLWAGKHIE